MLCCASDEKLQVRLAEAWHDVEEHVHITWQPTSDLRDLSFPHPPFFTLTTLPFAP